MAKIKGNEIEDTIPDGTEVEQTLANGAEVIFLFRGMLEDWEDQEELLEELKKYNLTLPEIEGRIFTVDSLETYTELGDKDYEYYNICWYMPDRMGIIEITGCSGYHLEPALTKDELTRAMAMANNKLRPEQIQELYIMWQMVPNRKVLNDLIKWF